MSVLLSFVNSKHCSSQRADLSICDTISVEGDPVWVPRHPSTRGERLVTHDTVVVLHHDHWLSGQYHHLLPGLKVLSPCQGPRHAGHSSTVNQIAGKRPQGWENGRDVPGRRQRLKDQKLFLECISNIYSQSYLEYLCPIHIFGSRV